MVRVDTADGMIACAVTSEKPAERANKRVTQSSLRVVLVNAQSAPVVVFGSTGVRRLRVLIKVSSFAIEAARSGVPLFVRVNPY